MFRFIFFFRERLCLCIWIFKTKSSLHFSLDLEADTCHKLPLICHQLPVLLFTSCYLMFGEYMWIYSYIFTLHFSGREIHSELSMDVEQLKAKSSSDHLTSTLTAVLFLVYFLSFCICWSLKLYLVLTKIELKDAEINVGRSPLEASNNQAGWSLRPLLG